MTTWTVALALAGPCDVDTLSALASVAVFQGPHPVERAAGRVEAACTGALAERAGQIAAAPPAERSSRDADLARAMPTEWTLACEGSLLALSDALRAPADERRPTLWRRCGLERQSWFSEAEWASADGTIALALITGHTLQSDQAPADVTRALVRALAGLEPEPQPEPTPPVLVTSPLESPLGLALGALDLSEGEAGLRTPFERPVEHRAVTPSADLAERYDLEIDMEEPDGRGGLRRDPCWLPVARRALLDRGPPRGWLLPRAGLRRRRWQPGLRRARRVRGPARARRPGRDHHLHRPARHRVR
jgi:hypothetical protein